MTHWGARDRNIIKTRERARKVGAALGEWGSAAPGPLLYHDREGVEEHSSPLPFPSKNMIKAREHHQDPSNTNGLSSG